MIKIVKIETHLDENNNVFSMVDDCNEMWFLVNANTELNYCKVTDMVRCPWGCGVEVALTVLLENYEQEQRLDHFIGNVHKVWSPDGVKEEQL